MILIAAAALGLLGSAHCVLMCGPLILAVGVPRSASDRAARLVYVGSYHAGRVVTYALLGAIAGAIGSVMGLAGLGRALALVAGGLLVVAGIGPAVARTGSSWMGPWISMAARASGTARRWQATHPITGPFASGLANGLLPCGMIYAALATALATGSIASASASMVAFGLGTVPALAGLSLGAAQIRPHWRHRMSRAAPIALVLVGMLLVGRALASPPAGPSSLPGSAHAGHHPGAHTP